MDGGKGEERERKGKQDESMVKERKTDSKKEWETERKGRRRDRGDGKERYKDSKIEWNPWNRGDKPKNDVLADMEVWWKKKNMGERDIERALTELSENERTGVRSSSPENGKEEESEGSVVG